MCISFILCFFFMCICFFMLFCCSALYSPSSCLVPCFLTGLHLGGRCLFGYIQHYCLLGFGFTCLHPPNSSALSIPLAGFCIALCYCRYVVPLQLPLPTLLLLPTISCLYFWDPSPLTSSAAGGTAYILPFLPSVGSLDTYYSQDTCPLDCLLGRFLLPFPILWMCLPADLPTGIFTALLYSTLHSHCCATTFLYAAFISVHTLHTTPYFLVTPLMPRCVWYVHYGNLYNTMPFSAFFA